MGPPRSVAGQRLQPEQGKQGKLETLGAKHLGERLTLPIVAKPDGTIIDGFHRWTVAGREPLRSMLNGMVPVVRVAHDNKAGDIFGTVTHNRARGVHLLEPMKKIVQELLAEGKSIEEIGKQMGMKPEEVFRLSDFSRDDFLDLMTMGTKDFSRAEIIKDV